MGSEYVLIYMNVSNCASIPNMPEYAEIYPNVGKYVLIRLSLWIWLNISET